MSREVLVISNRTRIDMIWAALAIAAFALGTLVYFLDRSPELVYFIPKGINPFAAPNGVFGVVGGNLPSFAHAFAMILITGAVLSSRGFECFVISLCWLLIEAVFEIGQLNGVHHEIYRLAPDWLESVPFFEAQKAFFVNGTFDSLDILASVFGAIAAYTIMSISH